MFEFDDGQTPGSVERAPFAALVPSSLNHFDFDVRCTVLWQAPPGARATVFQAVAGHAKKTLKLYHPTRWQLAGHHLAADLSTPCQLTSAPTVKLWAQDVTVTVEPQQLELAEQHAQRLRRQQHVDAEQEAERAELRYLRNTVFADTGTAALWWLRHNNHDITRITSVIDDLKVTVGVLDGATEQHWADTIIETFDSLVPNLNSNGRRELHQTLARILSSLGEEEKANIFLDHARTDETTAL